MRSSFTSLGMLTLAAVLFISCEDDAIEQESVKKITIQFENGTKEISENTGEQTIALKLSSPAVADGAITLKAGTGFSQNFTTVPSLENGLITIPLVKGKNAAELKLLPVDNTQKDGNRDTDLQFHNLPLHFLKGINSVLHVTVKDDETTPQVQSLANFIAQNVTLEEENTTGIDYQIHFSEPVATASEVRISITADKGVYGSEYTSLPAAEDNTITLEVPAGASVVSFNVRSVNNFHITGELKLDLMITHTNGSIKKGHNLKEVLIIKDDELAGKPRGYEVTSGNEVVKKFFEYDAAGRVSKVNWEYYTPYKSSGADTYYYDENGQLVRINKSPGREVLYRWDNGHIVKSENIRDGIMLSYADFEYDERGNVEGVVSYHRQNDGSYLKGMYTVYLYFTDGNLYKSLTYQDNSDREADPYLVSARTYDNYLNAVSPFDTFEVLPTVRTQRNLASTYRLEETGSGVDKSYQLSYEFRDDGLPGKRIASAPGEMQTAVYHYY